MLFHAASSLLLAVLGAEVLGGSNHVAERRLGLLPLAGLETAVRVDPELVGLEVLEHLLDAVLDLLLRRDTWAVDVVDTCETLAAETWGMICSTHQAQCASGRPRQ